MNNGLRDDHHVFDIHIANSLLQNIATPLLKTAKFESKYLENCHKSKNCQLGKFLRIFSSLQKCFFLKFLRQKLQK